MENNLLRKSARILFPILITFLGTVWALGQTAMTQQSSNATKRAAPADKPAAKHTRAKHQDHGAKHGGTFFMALDNMHHLEGVFEPPGIFRVYLYDAYTMPLSIEKMKKASGTVQVGDSPDAPKLPLALSKDGKTLELALPNLKFPFTLTVVMHFPDLPAGAPTELFTIPQSHYTNPNEHPASTMPASMPGMKR